MARVVGLFVIVAGILEFLLKSGVIPVTSVWMSGPVLWPLLLVLIGMPGLFKFLSGKQSRKFPFGSVFFIVEGLFLSLRASHHWMGLSQVGFWSLTGALIAVFVGFSLLFPKYGRFMDVIVVSKSRKKSWHSQKSWDSMKGKPTAQYDSYAKEPRRSLLILGDLSIGRNPWVLKDMRLWNGIGDIRVNLTTAHVENGTYKVEIHGWIGEVRVLVPEDLPVFIVANVSIGDILLFGEENAGTGRTAHHQDVEYATATRRCEIEIGLHIGEVEVVRV
jgi:lia operon protein LiaF